MVGGASTAGLPDNETIATLYLAGSVATNFLAASRAASSRLGATSVAAIDWEVSSTTITVALSLGTFTWATGRAHAPVMSASELRAMATATWRRH